MYNASSYTSPAKASFIFTHRSITQPQLAGKLSRMHNHNRIPFPNTAALLTSREAMAILRFKTRGAFWAAVYRGGIPLVRVNQRVIRFPAAGLHDWIRRNGSAAA